MKVLAILALAAVACALPLSPSNEGPIAIAVSDKCFKIFCSQMEIDLVSFPAQAPTAKPAVLSTLVAKEKSHAAFQVETLTATDGDNVFVLLKSPSAAPVLFTIQGRGTGSPASAPIPELADAQTMDFLAESLVFTTTAGAVLRVTNGTVTTVTQLPKGHTNLHLATTDGADKLFVATTDSTLWYIVTVSLSSATVEISAGAPYFDGGSFSSTSPAGIHFHPATNSLASMVVDILGARVGYVNVHNTSDFQPMKDVIGDVRFVGYTLEQGHGMNFLVGDVFYAVMDISSASSNAKSGNDDLRMTWVDFSVKHPPINDVLLPERSNGFLVLPQ